MQNFVRSLLLLLFVFLSLVSCGKNEKTSEKGPRNVHHEHEKYSSAICSNEELLQQSLDLLKRVESFQEDTGAVDAQEKKLLTDDVHAFMEKVGPVLDNKVDCPAHIKEKFRKIGDFSISTDGTQMPQDVQVSGIPLVPSALIESPERKGMRNIGNSCYLNTLLSLQLAFPDFDMAANSRNNEIKMAFTEALDQVQLSGALVREKLSPLIYDGTQKDPADLFEFSTINTPLQKNYELISVAKGQFIVKQGYQEVALIVHYGKDKAGHYTSRILHDDGKWYEHNDAVVSLIQKKYDHVVGVLFRKN